MEETQNQGPKAAAEDTTAPEPIKLWVVTEDEGTVSASDPNGWWSAKLKGDTVSITKLANVSVHNRPAGKSDSDDVTLVAPLGELIDRLIALESPSAEASSDLVEFDLGAYLEGKELMTMPASDIDRLGEILGADEETGLMAAAELWADGRDELEAEVKTLKTEISNVSAERDNLKSALAGASDEINRLAALTEKTEPETRPEGIGGQPPVFEVPGLPHQAVKALQEAGLYSEDALRAASDGQLIDLKGVAEASVKAIREFLGQGAPGGE